MASSSDARPFGARRALAATVCAAVVAASSVVSADEGAPSERPPKVRTCCAFAGDLPIHLGAAHMPVALSLVTSAASLGHHSYSGAGRMNEGTGLVYTRRGGFIDLGHTRDYADLTAYLAVHLRPLLAAGSGQVCLAPLDARRCVVVTSAVRAALLARTSASIAQRAAFELSVWAEIAQYYGRGKARGAEEIYSAFTPDDLYSNLLGTYLGRRASESARPYDDALDTELRGALERLGSVPTAEGKRIMTALAGRWWSRGTPWPSASIPLAHSFDIGPYVHPRLAPEDVEPPVLEGGGEDAAALSVPDVDAEGAPLETFYRVELEPLPDELPRLPPGAVGAVVTGGDLPGLVARVREAIDAAGGRTREDIVGVRDRASDTPLTHYLDGLRLLELAATGGIAAETAPHTTRGAFGASVTPVVGDTRGGDFQLARFGIDYTPERGAIGAFALLHADSVYFCKDPETGGRRPPLVSLLGPCARGEWLGFGGSLGEAFHDGATGRTALRPIGGYAVVNPLRNGQSPSYERVRLLLRAGAAVEHVWTQAEGGQTVPRLAGGIILLARTSGAQLEARGGAEYRVDPAVPEDAALQSTATLRWNFLLGGSDRGTTQGEGAAAPVDAVDPWGVGSLGITAGYSYWGKPAHSFADPSGPFVSDRERGTWQVILGASVGFEGLAF